MKFLNKRIPLIAVLSAIVLWSSTCKEAKDTNEFTIHTKFGEIDVLLYDATPLHRDNFKKLVSEGFYDSLLFHRVIQDFMIQGGDPTSKNAKPAQKLGDNGPGYTIESEFVDTLIHKKGALAAARQPDQVNPTKASSGSQFYIVQGRTFNDQELNQMEKSVVNQKKQQLQFEFATDSSNQWIREKYLAFTQAGKKDSAQFYSDLWTQKMMEKTSSVPSTIFSKEDRDIYKKIGGAPHLDRNYTVFGEVTRGLEILDSIAQVPVDQFNRPTEDVYFKITPKVE